MTLTAALFAAGARLRGDRLLHPRGRSFAGSLETFGTPGRAWGAALLDEPGVRPATVRVSKGAPTPAGWPDVLGLAIRLPGPVDLLLSSTARAPLVRHLPVPRRHFGAVYGTLLAVRARGRRIFLATVPRPGLGTTLADVADAAAGPGVELVLAAATRLSVWRPFGVLRFGEPLPAGTDAGLAFNAIAHPVPGLEPVGRLQRSRLEAYRGSQRGRAQPG